MSSEREIRANAGTSDDAAESANPFNDRSPRHIISSRGAAALRPTQRPSTPCHQSPPKSDDISSRESRQTQGSYYGVGRFRAGCCTRRTGCCRWRDCRSRLARTATGRSSRAARCSPSACTSRPWPGTSPSVGSRRSPSGRR